MKRIPLEGKTFGRWTVLEYLGKSLYSCKCSCGTERSIHGFKLTSGHSKSCGCSFKNIHKTLLGTHQKNGKLKAIEVSELRTGCGGLMLKCLCDCGNEHIVSANKFKSELTKSCGCSYVDCNRHTFKHGQENPNFNPRLTDEERIVGRNTEENTKWVKHVYEQDDYTCQKCGKRGTELNAHHLFNWADYPDLRYDTNNGITLCKTCHIAFHVMFGRKNNTVKQFLEFKET